MARRLREEAPDAIHHVIVQGNGGQAIFLDDVDRTTFLRHLCRVETAMEWCCLAYCLMSTHAHLVLRTPEPNLGRGMQRLVGGYAFSFNRRHGRSGHLFAGPYYSRIIEDESHVLRASADVVVNPVAARLCSHPSQWLWSSYRATMGEVADDAVDVVGLLALFDDDVTIARCRYTALVEDLLAEMRDRRASGA